MATTEDFKAHQTVMREIYNILQDEVFPIVDRRVDDWKYDNTGHDGRRLNGADNDDMIKEVSEQLGDLLDDVDWNVLNGVLKVIALFRLHRSFNYRGVGSDVRGIRQLQYRRKAAQKSDETSILEDLARLGEALKNFGE